jgi:hypothetical protein
MLPSYQVKGSTEPCLQPWLFQVQPYSEESFGHFLGRFRRANHLSSHHLSAMLGQKPHVVSYWESPSRQRQPESFALQRLSRLTGVAESRFSTMRLPSGTLPHWPTRLCACCYTEVPCHQLTWQIATQSRCEIHQRRLLGVCPQCGSAFRLPSYWQRGECDHCYFPFHKMSALQRG